MPYRDTIFADDGCPIRFASIHASWSHAHVSLTYWTWYDASAIFQANTASCVLLSALVISIINSDTDFSHRDTPDFRGSLSLSHSLLSRTAARKIVKVLRFNTHVIHRAICRRDLLIGPVDQYFTNRSFFKISELHVIHLHIQTCTWRRYFHNLSLVTLGSQNQIDVY